MLVHVTDFVHIIFNAFLVFNSSLKLKSELHMVSFCCHFLGIKPDNRLLILILNHHDAVACHVMNLTLLNIL